jgi:hypothetical protein
MFKMLPMTFRGSIKAWCNNLKPGSVINFSNLYIKLVAHFSTRIPTKKSSIKLFRIIQTKNESTKTYLKRFNKEMLKVKDLIEQVASEALIN